MNTYDFTSPLFVRLRRELLYPAVAGLGIDCVREMKAKITSETGYFFRDYSMATFFFQPFAIKKRGRV